MGNEGKKKTAAFFLFFFFLSICVCLIKRAQAF